MASDEVLQQAEGLHLLQYCALHAGQIGQRAFRRGVADMRQHKRQRGYRHGKHDQGFAVGGAGQGLVEVLGGVEAVEFRRLHRVDGAVVPENVAPGGGSGAHHGAPD